MKLLPSVMCIDFSDFENELKNLEEAGIDGYHIDIIDGHFVKNFGLGQQDVQAIRKASNKPLDIHLMTKTPYDFIDYFDMKPGDMVHIHPEVDPEPSKTIQKLNNMGLRSSIVLSPSTSIASIQELLNIVDAVLVMTVNLGFAGQTYLEFVDNKIEELSKVRLEKKLKFEIYTDGALSRERISKQLTFEVDGFVLGTAGLFNKEESYTEVVTKLRNL